MHNKSPEEKSTQLCKFNPLIYCNPNYEGTTVIIK